MKTTATKEIDIIAKELGVTLKRNGLCGCGAVYTLKTEDGCLGRIKVIDGEEPTFESEGEVDINQLIDIIKLMSLLTK